MALNIQSGSTWAEIRAELNNKSLDKTGDDMTGALGINDMVTDSQGRTAIETDSENQKIKFYGEYAGNSLCSETSFTFKLIRGSGENIFSIELPRKYERGMCTIDMSYGSGSDQYIIWFSSNRSGAKGIYMSGVGNVYLWSTGSDLLEKIYLEDNFIKIICTAPLNYDCSGTINWEVW